MEKYQFTTLAWLNLSDRDATKASKWYQGSGWYFNPVDERGERLPAHLIQESEFAAVGEFEALRLCGQEGWFVAALLPPRSEGVWEHVVSGLLGTHHSAPHFLLQRRTVG